MIELKKQSPYIDDNGYVRPELEKHYAEDENGVKYKIIQVETNTPLDEAVDVIPCKYTYKATEKLVEIVEDGDNGRV